MSIKLIQDRLDSYNCKSELEEEHAIREITQEVALAALGRTDFFKYGIFQGGTCLRIFYGLNRFSEDLDFILQKPDPDFSWPVYLRGMAECFTEFGIKSEIVDKSRMDQRIKKALVKDNSLGNQLNLSFFRGDPERKQKIKLEIDVDPPVKSDFGYSYLDFPLDFEVCHQDLSSNFSLKIHNWPARNVCASIAKY